ncbi:hypothetical protein L2K70_12695 [Nocardioides KLBMP 9356]|uniref:Histidine kinase/HSP90-like ATPase domain-containing protein n=1 Tax=Nocardioides potassii TaxID=2911371 RepID=A0ABS9HDT7_9ACTN|nr:hypothetical protein [Nocardioides potassii]MCF6378462.1 hypothetical protein [Nocardioides potassii]
MSWPVWAAVTTPPPVPSTTSGSAYRMYRSILGAHTAILVSLCAFSVLPWIGRIGPGTPTFAVRTVIALVLLTAATTVFRVGERRWLLGMLCVTFLLATPSLGIDPVPNDSTVGMVLSAVGVMAARLLPLIRAMALVALLSGVHVLTQWLLGLPTSGLSLDATVLSLGTAAAAVGMVNAMQASAIATEAMSVDNRARELELVHAEAELRASTTSRRVLHDDVLGTLHLVSDGVAPADRIRRQCRATVDAILAVIASTGDEDEGDDRREVRGPDGLPESYAVLVDALQHASPIPVEVSVVGRPQRLPGLSDAQRAALLRASSEGVRNSARHGKADRVTLRISSDRDVTRFEVLDRGVGLAPSHSRGFGLQESVERPLAEVGGRSALLPRPDGGAALVLVLPREQRVGSRLLDAHGRTTDGLGSVRTLSRAVAIPLGTAWCVIAVHAVVIDPRLWTSLPVGLGWLLATAFVIRSAERGAPGTRWVVFIASMTIALQVIGIALLPDGAMLDFRSWSIGMSALPLVVFVLSLPTSVACVVLLAHIGVVLVAPVLRPELTAGLVPWGSLNAVITCPVPSMVLGSLIRRQGRSLEEQQARERTLEHRRAVEAWQAAMTDLYFAHVRLEVLPWLEAVADGLLDPDTDEVRKQATLLAVAARDDLYAPGFFDDSLRADVAHFRSRGGAVELRAGLVPGGFERPVGDVLRGLLPVSHGRRIIVSPPAPSERHVRISVVPAPHVGDIERLRTTGPSPFEADVDAFRAVLLVDDLPLSG